MGCNQKVAAHFALYRMDPLFPQPQMQLEDSGQEDAE